jgi:photosystem I subunit 11
MTVTPASDPCVGNLATPVNSGYFIKGLINNLPLYREGISPNFRGLETGAAFGYLLYGPFTICGPLRATEFQDTAGVLAAIGAVHILTLLFLLYNQPGKQPHIPPSDVTVNNPPSDLFTRTGLGRLHQWFLARRMRWSRLCMVPVQHGSCSRLVQHRCWRLECWLTPPISQPFHKLNPLKCT